MELSGRPNTIDDYLRTLPSDYIQWYTFDNQEATYANLKLLDKVHDSVNDKMIDNPKSLPSESDWKVSKEIKEKEIYNNFQNFLQGKGKLPVLKEISKKIKNIGGNERFDLQENIENSITLHWVYVHKSRLNDFIEEYID